VVDDQVVLARLVYLLMYAFLQLLIYLFMHVTVMITMVVNVGIVDEGHPSLPVPQWWALTGWVRAASSSS